MQAPEERLQALHVSKDRKNLTAPSEAAPIAGSANCCTVRLHETINSAYVPSSCSPQVGPPKNQSYVEEPVRTAVLTQLAFQEAAEAWLESRRPYISARTQMDYGNYIKTLSLFFTEIRLPEITADHIRAYQKMRMARAGASAINHECSILQQMLKRLGLWKDIEADYQPLKLPKESPHRALTDAEEERLYRIGPTNPAWEVAYCAFIIGINTTIGPGELRRVHLSDVELDHHECPLIHIPPEAAKREGRIRTIPLNEVAANAVRYLVDRAHRLGSTASHHYLLPFRVKRGTYDPTKPAKGWRTAHDEMCAAAGIKVTQYSYRHHAITKLLENPDVSEETVEAIAGHVSPEMKKRYSHTRLNVRKAAVDALVRISRK
jgi:integrase